MDIECNMKITNEKPLMIEIKCNDKDANTVYSHFEKLGFVAPCRGPGFMVLRKEDPWYKQFFLN